MSVQRKYSYVSKEKKESYRYDTVIDVFLEESHKRPYKEIFISRQIGVEGSRRTLTNQELEIKMKKVAKHLLLKGLQKNDRVALFGPNSIERIIAEMGIILAGGVVVQVAITKENGSDLLEIMKLTDCKGLIIDQGIDGLFEEPYQLVLKSLLMEEYCRFILCLRKINHHSKLDYFSEVINKPLADAYFPCLYPEDVIEVYSTSGSTGKPKLVEHTHFGLVNSIPAFDFNIVVYADRPFAWFGGTISTVVCGKGVRVFIEPPVAVSENKMMDIWNIMQEEKCATAFLLPYMVNDLLAMRNTYHGPFKLQSIITAGEIIKPSVTDLLGIFCDALIIGYGSTETSAVSWNAPILPGSILEMGDVGEVVPGVEVKVIGEDGNVTKMGESGELCVRSHLHCNKSKLESSPLSEYILPNGWMKIGDVGRITPSGRIIIEGKSKDIISRGTRKILPASIEDVILQMKGIKHAIVVGVPDERLYEEVCVCFVPQDDQDITCDQVEEYCKMNMTKEKSLDGLGLRPKYFFRYKSFPILPAGKFDRVFIRKLATEAIHRRQNDV